MGRRARVLRRLAGRYVVMLACAGAWAAQATGPSAAAGQDAATSSGATRDPGKQARPPAGTAFDRVVEEAAAARDANELAEALALYEKAIRLRPSFVEGHWYVATIRYELEQFGPARDTFRRVVSHEPENGPAWAYKGLCEFRLGHHDAALDDLLRARALGLDANPELIAVARYHTALLLARGGEYEQALHLLAEFAEEGNDSPSVVEAMGIAALRLPVLPAELPPEKAPEVVLAGRATYFAAARLKQPAQDAFEDLVSSYPATPNARYAYGVFLMADRPEAAVELFRQELEINPRHPFAKLQLAFEYIRRREWDAARPWAEQVVSEAPTLFAGRRALGEVLLADGDTEGAIREFEAGVKIEPNSPALRLALARAYRRAGRTADAERQRLEFLRLERVARRAGAGPQWAGAIDLEVVEQPAQHP